MIEVTVTDQDKVGLHCIRADRSRWVFRKVWVHQQLIAVDLQTMGRMTVPGVCDAHFLTSVLMEISGIMIIQTIIDSARRLMPSSILRSIRNAPGSKNR